MENRLGNTEENVLSPMRKDVKKDYAISILRLVSTVCIVLCHFFQYYDIDLAWRFNMGVQIFLLISGFLYGCTYEHFTVEKVWKNIKKIFVPYLIFIAFALVLHCIFNFGALSFKRVTKQIFLLYFLPGLGHLWYVPLILFLYAVTPFLAFFKKKIAEKNAWLSIIYKVVFIGVLLMVNMRYFSAFEYCWTFCYLVGFLFAENFKKPNVPFLALFILLAVGAVLLQYAVFVRGWTVYNEESRAFTAVLLFGVAYTLLRLIPFKADVPLLNMTDTYSYHVYLCHQIFILGPISLLALTPLVGVNILLAIVAIAALVVATVLVEKGIEKLFELLK